MVLNTEIFEILKVHNIPKNQGIPYLLAVYYGYSDSPLFPKNLKIKMQTVGILSWTMVDKVYKPLWDIDLFVKEGKNPLNNSYAWIHKYLELFEKSPAMHIGDFKTCLVRFQNFLIAHPDVEINEIRKATQMYLRETDPRYIRKPHYFIKKGAGKEAVEDLYEWILKLRRIEEISSSEGKNSLSNTMQ